MWDFRVAIITTLTLFFLCQQPTSAQELINHKSNLKPPIKLEDLPLVNWEPSSFDLKVYSNKFRCDSADLKRSPDGKHLAFLHSTYLTVYGEKNSVILDFFKIEQLPLYKNQLFNHFFWTKNSQNLIFCNKKALYKYSPLDKTVKSYTNFDGAVHSVSLSPDGLKLACAGTLEGVDAHTEVHVLDTKTMSILKKIKLSHVWGVSWSPTSDQIILVSESGSVNVYNLGKNEYEYSLNLRNVLDVCWSADGSKMAFVDGSSFIKIYSSRDGRLIQEVKNMDLKKLAWSADGKCILVQKSGLSPTEFYVKLK